MHFALHLFAEVGGCRCDELANVRTEFARRWIYNLEFFLDANRESVAHERNPLVHTLRGCKMLSQFAAAGISGLGCEGSPREAWEWAAKFAALSSTCAKRDLCGIISARGGAAW